MTPDQSSPSVRWIDRLSALVLLAAALFVGYRFVAAAKPPARRAPPPYAVSEPLGAVPELGLARARSTAIVVLSPTCEFCKQSVPLYRELGDIAGDSGGSLRVVFVASSDVGGIRRLLQEGGIPMPDIVDKPRELRVGPVPMVILTTPAGKVEKAWIGLLKGDAKEGFLDSVRAAAQS